MRPSAAIASATVFASMGASGAGAAFPILEAIIVVLSSVLETAAEPARAASC
jgi:hypothetical protein